MTHTANPGWLVFTDLDGTLLDHDSYDWSPAAPALARLRELAIPVVPVSSKTLAELEPLCEELGLAGPRIAENGAVVEIPSELTEVTRPAYQEILEILDLGRARFGWQFTGFGDMTPQTVAEATGLTPAQAMLATRRLASEPILWQGPEEQLPAFTNYLQDRGLRTLQGGRFLHVLGLTDKGDALQRVRDRIDPRARTIALGDSPNDQTMLEIADYPVVIRRKHAGHMVLERRSDALFAEHAGPRGWNHAVCSLLDARQKEHNG